MTNPKVRIESDGFMTEIYVDGVKVEHAVECDFHAEVGCATCVVSTYLLPGSIEKEEPMINRVNIDLCKNVMKKHLKR